MAAALFGGDDTLPLTDPTVAVVVAVVAGVVAVLTVVLDREGEVTEDDVAADDEALWYAGYGDEADSPSVPLPFAPPKAGPAAELPNEPC